MTELPQPKNSSGRGPGELPRRSWKQRFFAVGLILGLLVSGGLAARFIIKSRPRVKRRPPGEMVTLVETVKVAPEDTRVEIRAQGRMVPAREIILKARVTGSVVYLHPHLVPGGIIRKGEILLRLDDTDYRLNYQRLQDALVLEEANLRLEEGSQTVARQEWEMIRKLGGELGGEVDDTSRDLALRKPQLAKIKARIKSARTALERARVDLERTVIRAPFNLVVRSEDVDVGSEVTTATRIATLAEVDVFWAEISVPVSRLDWFDLPAKGRPASPVRIFAGNDPPRPGRIISLAPDLDQNGLMARILVAVADPLGLRHRHRPLLLGTFVRARITGYALRGVFRVPRLALRDDDRLFLVDAENRLHHQPVHVVWKDLDNIFVDRGLKPGDQVIVSSLATPIEGMLLKVVTPLGRGGDETVKAGSKTGAGRVSPAGGRGSE